MISYFKNIFDLMCFLTGRTFRQYLQTGSCIWQCGHVPVVSWSVFPDGNQGMEWNRSVENGQVHDGK